MQISLRIADPAKSFLASTEDPKAAWKSLEKRLVRSSKGCNLTTLRGDLDTYKKFAKPVEISAAGGGKIYAYSSGTLRVATLANGLETSGRSARRILRTWRTCAARVTWEARRPRMGISAYAMAEWSCEIGMGTCSPTSRG